MREKIYRAIAMDFDGVLVESNTIKDRAFEMVFADYPEHHREILGYHKRTSLIRFEKFRYIVEKILGKTYTPELEKDLAEKFSAYCIEEVSACPWVAGAKEFLDDFKGRLPLYLVSINPMEDLKAILANRGMAHYFKKVYAAQKSKAGQLKDILEQENLLPAQAVFIGDAVSDYTSAMDAGMDFIGRRSAKELHIEGVPMFENFYEISDYINERLGTDTSVCP